MPLVPCFHGCVLAELRTSTGSLVRPLVKLEPVFGPSSYLGPEDVAA